MKKIMLGLGIIAVSGCAAVSGTGSSHNTPLTAISANNKISTQCTKTLFGMISLDDNDMSYYAVARKGNISSISTTDVTLEGVPGLYDKRCLIIHGN